MYTAAITLGGISAMSQSRYTNIQERAPQLDKESHDDYDARIWREKAHCDEKTGQVFIPAMALKQSLDGAAKYAGEKIVGKGSKTWAAKFTSGALVLAPLPITVAGKPFLKDKLEMEQIHANADGIRGSGKRVWRRFPVIPQGWQATGEIVVVDETIVPDVLKRYLADSGLYVGLGRFRPAKGGFLGRFSVERFSTK